jgi:hypothetical protein
VSLDPLACKPPGDALLRPGNCSALGFGVAAGHDPVFRKITLWKKDPGPPPINYTCGADGYCETSGATGLPAAQCQQACVPPPAKNYTCQNHQCVVAGRGLSKAKCAQICK